MFHTPDRQGSSLEGPRMQWMLSEDLRQSVAEPSTVLCQEHSVHDVINLYYKRNTYLQKFNSRLVTAVGLVD